jgi:choice-of-anchor A domain-containing protein
MAKSRPAARLKRDAIAILSGATALVMSAALMAFGAAATPYATLQSIAGTYNVFLLGDPESRGVQGSATFPYTGNAQSPVAIAGDPFFGKAPVDRSATPVIPEGAAEQGGQIGNILAGFTTAGLNNLPGAQSQLSAAGSGSSTGIYVTQSTQVNDPFYWTAPAISSEATTGAALLDTFGSASDLTDASKAQEDSGTVSFTVAGGNIGLTLAHSGLNTASLAIPDGAMIRDFRIAAAPDVTPTGLVITVVGHKSSFSGWSLAPGPLDPSQILLDFPTGETLTLGSLSFDGGLLPSSAAVDFVGSDLSFALIDSYVFGNNGVSKGGFAGAPADCIASDCPNGASQPARYEPSGAQKPDPERDGIAIIDASRAEFAASRSVDARAGVRIGLQIKIHRFLGLTHNARGWTGIYKGSRKSEDGSRSIAIEIAPGIVIATWDSRFVDAPYHTMVKPFAAMARVLDGLTIGQPVIFSADLLGSVIASDDDMVMRPRIIARITALKSVDALSDR